MDSEVENIAARRSRDILAVSLCWLAGILAFYVLSIGPAMKISMKQNIGTPNPTAEFFKDFYKPLEWAYAHTVLHKPLGLYYHLWIPSVIDSKGDVIYK